MEVVSQDEMVLGRYPKVTDPLKTLIGDRASPRRRAVPIEELEERIESR
jgi:hypothetical protein